MATLSIGTQVEAQKISLRSNEAGYPLAKSKIVQVTPTDALAYFFPYTPVASTFDGIGAEYSEISRPGDYAIVSRKAPNLLKASFDFRIAHRPSNGQEAISKDLDILHRMATADLPVVISGIGGYFAGLGVSGSVKFRILSLNVEIVTLSPDNEPWQANCSMELIEDRNPTFNAVTFATITYSVSPPAKTTSTASLGNRTGTTPTSPTVAPVPVTYSQLNTTTVTRVGSMRVIGGI